MSEASKPTGAPTNIEDTRHPSVIEAHHRLDRMRDEIIRLGLGHVPQAPC